MSIAVSPPTGVAATTVRYRVLAWLCIATTIAYIDRGCIAVAQKPIGLDLGLNDKKMGLVMGAFFLAYAVFQLPAGGLGQRWGSRRALPIFAAVWSAATGLAGIAGGLPILLASRLGMGAAEAGVFPCATGTLARWFPSTRRALVSGVLGGFMGIGGALGAALTGWLLGWMSWRWMFLLYAVPGLLWAGWFAWWFRDRPEDHWAVNDPERNLIREGAFEETGKDVAPAPTPWRQIFTSPVMWWVNGQQFFRAAGYVFYISWFPTYLMETRGVHVAEAGVLSSLPHWAQLFGSLAGGIAADWVLFRTGNRRLSRQGLPVVSLFLCAGLIAASFFVANVWLAVLIISLGAVSASLGGPCAYAVTIDTGGQHVAAVFSTMNMAGNVGAVLFPIAVPWLVHTTGNWDLALFVFAAVHLAAAICWLFVNPNGTIAREDPSPTVAARTTRS